MARCKKIYLFLLILILLERWRSNDAERNLTRTGFTNILKILK